MTFKTFGKKDFDKGDFKSFGKKPKLFPKPPPQERLPDQTSAEEDRIRRLLDNRLAKRIMQLKRAYPDGSLPELVAMDYLNRNRVQYIYQGSAFGGRRRRGGYVPDFVVAKQGQGLVIQIQGEYWHSKARKGFADKDAKVRLLGQWVNGMKVRQVVEVWENDLYHGRAERTMALALTGQELR